MKNVNVHHEVIFKNVIIISFAYTFTPDEHFRHSNINNLFTVSVCVLCIVLQELLCYGLIEYNFCIPYSSLFVLNVFMVENKSCKSGVAWDTTRSDLLFCGNLQIYSP